MFRRRPRQPEGPVDPVQLDTLEPRWRSAVEETLASRARLHDLVAQAGTGPLRDRLASLTERLDAGVVAAWQTASRAQATSRTVTSMDLDRVTAQLKDARRRGAGAEAELLAEQHAALNQLSNAVDDAAERLRLLDLRLDTAVARAAQLVLRPDAVEALAAVDQELGAVVEEIDALRAGFDAVGG
jgi:hypothetical protein